MKLTVREVSANLCCRRQRRRRRMRNGSNIREPSHGPFDIWKLLVSRTEKTRDLLSIMMKVALSISLLASIAILFLSAFSFQRRQQQLKFQVQTTYQNHSGEYLENSIENVTSISHILFGIGGAAKSWKDRRRYIELWWKPNVTRGFVWLDRKPNDTETWPETSPPFRVSANTSRFKFTSSYGSRSAIRIARIVLESFRLGLKDVRWFVLGDDDTVFFTKNLVSVLAKYDHNRMHYIGGISESVEQDVIHSYTTAYGGGGFAISYPLAAELVTLLDACIDRYHSLFGSDERIAACMDEIGIRATTEPGFHQVDVRGSAYGLLAAHPMAPLVSLHHLDAIEPLIPNRTMLESLKTLFRAYDKDPARVVQQSFCYDLQRNWSVSVSWGYSVQIYVSSLLTAKELSTPLRTFETWRSWSKGPFSFNTRPVKVEPCKQVARYFLSHVIRGGDETMSWYVRLGDEGWDGYDQEQCGPRMRLPKKINVVASKMGYSELKMGTRRQCCEVINRGDESEKSVVQVRIRKCNAGEALITLV